VLIYNVGTAAFNTASSEGIICEFEKAPAPPAPDDRPFAHFTSYEVVPADSAFRCWRPKSAAPAGVKGIRCSHAGGEIKAGQVWAWVQQRLDRGDPQQSQDPIQGDYAIEIDIHPSSGFSPNTCTWLKPLLDGIVSECHSQPYSLDDELVSRVAVQLNREPECIRRWLTRPELCLLANRSPVETYRSNVRWHPDDNRCVAAAVRIRSDGTPRWRLGFGLLPRWRLGFRSLRLG